MAYGGFSAPFWGLPVDAAMADPWGILAESLHSGGSPIGTVDGLIAATAFNQRVVTRNARDLEKTGVRLPTPWKSW
jgi:predicted nucleic acid-binding protein